MSKNSLLVILIFLLIKKQDAISLSSLSSLQIAAMVDQLHGMIHAMEKLNDFRQLDLSTALPDMKKILEAVEKIPL